MAVGLNSAFALCQFAVLEEFGPSAQIKGRLHFVLWQFHRQCWHSYNPPLPPSSRVCIDTDAVRRYCQTILSDSMKTIPLRSLLREPMKVKRLTRSGQSVQVTDNGKPLWVIQPAAQEVNDEERARAIDELLEEALRSARSPVSAAALLEESRR